MNRLHDKWSIPLDLGFSVIPVEPHGKKPLGEWKPFMMEAADAATVSRWAANNNCNVGIVTGDVSVLVVCDFDTEAAEVEAQRLGLPVTVTVKTGRGRHYYFKAPFSDFRIRKPKGFPHGMDIQADGKFVVAPGSIHPDGSIYDWENHPDIFPLADLPEWLLEPVEDAHTQATDDQADEDSQISPQSLDDLRSALEAIDADDRDVWQRVGHHLKTAGEVGKALWLSWSKTSEKFDRADAERVWDSLNPTKTHWRAVFTEAMTNWGWENHGKRRDAKEAFAAETEGEVSLSDFWAHMPSHRYIFSPTGELWPSSSVNSRIGRVDEGDDAVAAATWLDRNRAVEQMTWVPGQAEVIENRLVADGGWIDRQGCRTFNLYKPPLPIEGDPARASRWLDHLWLVYPNEAEHIIQWLAHRVQRPHEKINHALVLGGGQGIGKDTLLEPVKCAVGPWNFTEVSPQAMLGRFNGFVKSVILRVSEARDLGDADRFAFYDHMKTYTAAPPDVLRVDEKHKAEYAVFNVCGVIITSNHKLDGIYLPDDDRRHFVAWSELTKEDFEPGYWDALWAWYEAGGVGHVCAYLATLDLALFAAKAPPPKTAAFFDIVASNRPPEDAELESALEELGRPNAVTLMQVMEVADVGFSQWLGDRRNSRFISHRMSECGYERIANPNDKRGAWRVFGGRSVIYARRDLTLRDRVIAAQDLIAKSKKEG